jgi:hypothetical protein
MGGALGLGGLLNARLRLQLADPDRWRARVRSGFRYRRRDNDHIPQADRGRARRSRPGDRREREQTRATFKQTEATFDLQQMRDASEADAFHVMLEAAMARVCAEASWVRNAYPDILTQTTGASVNALAVRQCITKGAFAELRAACIRRGGPLTGDFLDLEREIDSFALQSEDRLTNSGVLIRYGKLAGLNDQLALIETKAEALRQKAFEAFRVRGV